MEDGKIKQGRQKEIERETERGVKKCEIEGKREREKRERKKGKKEIEIERERKGD